MDTQSIPRNTGTSRMDAGLEGHLEPGVVLQNRYLILGILGVGGMGSVYQARDMRFPNVTKLVAVKEMISLTPDPALHEMIVRNFEREADLLATLSHPAIPEIFDYFSQGTRSYLVLEFINGRDLEALLVDRGQPFNAGEAIDWAVQLCDVLHYLHTRTPVPVVFRDMKPSNVMLDHHRHIRLIDFGIAKGFQLNQRGTMIGTEGYSPPEQYRGEASPAGDLYALGATLHHLLTNQDPRLEPPFSFSERPIGPVNASVTPELENVIATALAYNPSDRFPTAEAMKAALLALQGPPAGGPAIASGPSQPVAADTVQAVWSFECEDEVRGSPVTAAGVVYAGAYDNNLYALDEATGQMLWKYPTDGGIAGTPAVWEEMVFVGSEDHRLHAVSTRTGKVLWTYYAKGPIRSSPRVAEGHVFVGSDDGFLHAINAASGRGVWKAEANGAIRSTAAVTQDRIFFGCESGDFYCLDFGGSMKWRFKAKRAITSSPVPAGNMIYVASVDWTLYALEAVSGWPVWRFRMGKPSISTPAVGGSAVLIASADGCIYSLDARSGKEIWRHATEEQVTASPLVHSGSVYCGSVDGHLYCLDAVTGKLRWRFRTGGPITGAPCVANDLIFIGSHDRRIYALAA